MLQSLVNLNVVHQLQIMDVLDISSLHVLLLEGLVFEKSTCSLAVANYAFFQRSLLIVLLLRCFREIDSMVTVSTLTCLMSMPSAATL